MMWVGPLSAWFLVHGGGSNAMGPLPQVGKTALSPHFLSAGGSQEKQKQTPQYQKLLRERDEQLTSLEKERTAQNL